MIKVVCDKCGKNITGYCDDPVFKVEISDDHHESGTMIYDLCTKCREELAKFLNDEEGLKHD